MSWILRCKAWKSAPPVRAEYEVAVGEAQFGEVERPLSAWERLTNVTWVRRAFIVAMLALAW
ncbi:MAG: hypothetical protein ACKOEE_11935, partial [Tagaea sp.]